MLTQRHRLTLVGLGELINAFENRPSVAGSVNCHRVFCKPISDSEGQRNVIPVSKATELVII